jgi:hypothetical protein
MLRLSSWELVGVISYTLTFALLESLAIWISVVLLGAILPARLLRDKLVAQGSGTVFVTAGWAVAAHYNADGIRQWGLGMFALGFALYLASIGVLGVLIRRHKKLEKLICSLVERLSILSFVYVSLGLVSLVVVIARNI